MFGVGSGPGMAILLMKDACLDGQCDLVGVSRAHGPFSPEK